MWSRVEKSGQPRTAISLRLAGIALDRRLRGRFGSGAVRGGGGLVRRWRDGPRKIRRGRHGAVRVQQTILARTQSQLDQRPRIRNFLGLPAMVALIAAHGVFALLVPGAAGFAAQIVFADESFLNRPCPFRIDLLLAADALCLYPVMLRVSAARRTARRPLGLAYA
jgi:hypothetical protein